MNVNYFMDGLMEQVGSAKKKIVYEIFLCQKKLSIFFKTFKIKPNKSYVYTR